MFLVQHQCFSLKRTTTLIFGEEGVCNKTFCSNNPCLQNVKSHRLFGANSNQNLVDVQQKVKMGICAHLKAKNTLRCYYLVQVGVIFWSKFGSS